jgi:DNA processing protein
MYNKLEPGIEELSYWMALAHIRGMTNRRKNELLSKIIEHEKKSIIDFYHAGPDNWSDIYKLDKKEINLFLELRED